MKRRPRPPLGTTMFCVLEHRYYIPGRAGPAFEYVVFEGKVKGYIEGGWVDMMLRGVGADGGVELVERRLQDIGTKVFHTAVEAARLARDMTEDYERRWAWMARWGDIPLRRPWAALLMEESTRSPFYV